MAQANWSFENEVLLKSLRLKAGLDLATLARKTIVSTAQVHQLEEGGDSAFYNSEIKFSIGKKLLKYLGHELIVTEPINHSSLQNFTNTSNTQAPSVRAHSAKAPVIYPSRQFHFFGMGKFLLAIIFVACMFLFLWFITNSSDLFNQPDQVHIVKNHPDKSQVFVSRVETFDEVTDKVDSDKKLNNLNSETEPCHWQNFEVAISPAEPRKKGDYVHLVPTEPTIVCLQSENATTSAFHLAAGESKSIYGRSPFIIFSKNLTSIKIFYQGQLIKLPDTGAQQIKLISNPAFKN